jgi:hypothetical protein
VDSRISGVLLATLVLALVPSLGAGCGGKKDEDASTAGVCAPGRSIACTGAGNCDGHQVCLDDGSRYDVCVCASDGAFPEAGPNSGLIGATCENDADCRAGLACLAPTSSSVGGEGPSAGLCVAECARDDGTCEDRDETTTCVVLDDRGTSTPNDDAAFCLPTCTLGEPDAAVDKCRGRIDLVCAEDTVGTGVGFCRPACRSDVDCGDRHCNLSTGFCADSPTPGDPIGSNCDPTAPECACIEQGSSYAECSGVCRLGTVGCGQDTADGPPFDYYCYLDPAGEGGLGDLGYCARACDCNDDCGRADAVCEPHPDLTEATGRQGVCGPAVYASGGPRPNIPCN